MMKRTWVALVTFALISFAAGGSNSFALTRYDPSKALQGSNYFGDALNAPSEVVSDGSNLWVTDSQPQTVSEFSGSTGRLETVTPLAIGNPISIATDSTHVWVADFYGGKLAELSRSSGALLSVISIPGQICPCDESFPLAAISDDGSDVWYTEFDPPYSGTVTEVNAATDSIVRSQSFGDASVPFQPSAVASDGTKVWVATVDGVVEFSASTGAMLQTILGPDNELINSTGIATDGTHVWVSSPAGVVELSGQSGDYLRTIATPPLVGGLSGLSSDGANLWAAVANGVIQISEASGLLVKSLDGHKYGIRGAIGVTSDESRVWIMDKSPGSLDELSAGGILLHPVTAEYDLPSPIEMCAQSDSVWVLGFDGSQADGSLSELSPATGHQEAFIGGASDPIGLPYQCIDDGPEVWTLTGDNQGQGNVLTEVSTKSRRVVRSMQIGGSAGVPWMTLSVGRLWVVTAPYNSIEEFSASSGRHLGTFSDRFVDLPNGIVGIASSHGSLILAGPTRLVLLSGSTGRPIDVWHRDPYCPIALCALDVLPSGVNTAWLGVLGSTSLSQYSLKTGAILRTLTGKSMGLTYLASFSLSGNDLWVIGKKLSDAGPNQGWLAEDRAVTTGLLEHIFTGGKFGFQGPGDPLVLGSQVWDTDSGGDAVSEWQHGTP